MIEFEKVTKKYSGKTAIDSISFHIKSGTACGYIGPNGAGKTTTAKIIVGLENQNSGEVRVSTESDEAKLNDRPSLSNFRLRSTKPVIGYVPESPKLYESMTPIETIALAALLRKFDKKEAIKKLEAISEIFSFGEYLKKPVQSISKGIKQKVVISLALIFNPKILVLDEPTDGLDVQAVVTLKKLLKSFTSHGGTVFYSSHLLDVVESVCDKVLFIDKGKIVREYLGIEFKSNRGYLENVFMEQVGAKNQLVDTFFENKL